MPTPKTPEQLQNRAADLKKFAEESQKPVDKLDQLGAEIAQLAPLDGALAEAAAESADRIRVTAEQRQVRLQHLAETLDAIEAELEGSEALAFQRFDLGLAIADRLGAQLDPAALENLTPDQAGLDAELTELIRANPELWQQAKQDFAAARQLAARAELPEFQLREPETWQLPERAESGADWIAKTAKEHPIAATGLALAGAGLAIWGIKKLFSSKSKSEENAEKSESGGSWKWWLGGGVVGALALYFFGGRLRQMGEDAVVGGISRITGRSEEEIREFGRAAGEAARVPAEAVAGGVEWLANNETFAAAKDKLVNSLGGSAPDWLKNLNSAELLEFSKTLKENEWVGYGSSAGLAFLLYKFAGAKGLAINATLYFGLVREGRDSWVQKQLEGLLADFQAKKTAALEKLRAKNPLLADTIAEHLDFDIRTIGDASGGLLDYAKEHPIASMAAVNGAWLLRGLIWKFLKLGVFGGLRLAWNNLGTATVAAGTAFAWREQLAQQLADAVYPSDDPAHSIFQQELMDLVGESDESVWVDYTQSVIRALESGHIEAVRDIIQLGLAEGEFAVHVDPETGNFWLHGLRLAGPVAIVGNTAQELFTQAFEAAWERGAWGEAGALSVTGGVFILGALKGAKAYATIWESGLHGGQHVSARSAWRVLKTVGFPITNESRFVLRSMLDFQTFANWRYAGQVATVERSIGRMEGILQSGLSEAEKTTELKNLLKELDVRSENSYHQAREQLKGSRYSQEILKAIEPIENNIQGLRHVFDMATVDEATKMAEIQGRLSTIRDSVEQYRTVYGRTQRWLTRLSEKIFHASGSPLESIRAMMQQSVPAGPASQSAAGNPANSPAAPDPAPQAQPGQRPSLGVVEPDGSVRPATQPRPAPISSTDVLANPAQAQPQLSPNPIESNLPANDNLPPERARLSPAQSAELASLEDQLAQQHGAERLPQIRSAANTLLRVAGPAFALLTMHEIASSKDPIKTTAEQGVYLAAFLAGSRVAPGHPLFKLGVGTVSALGAAVFGKEKIDAAFAVIQQGVDAAADATGASRHVHIIGKSLGEALQAVSLDWAFDRTTGEIWKGENAFNYFSDTTTNIAATMNPFASLEAKKNSQILHRDASDIESWNQDLTDEIKTAEAAIKLAESDLQQAESVKTTAPKKYEDLVLDARRRIRESAFKVAFLETQKIESGSVWFAQQAELALAAWQELAQLDSAGKQSELLRARDAFKNRIRTYQNMSSEKLQVWQEILNAKPELAASRAAIEAAAQ